MSASNPNNLNNLDEQTRHDNIYAAMGKKASRRAVSNNIPNNPNNLINLITLYNTDKPNKCRYDEAQAGKRLEVCQPDFTRYFLYHHSGYLVTVLTILP